MRKLILYLPSLLFIALYLLSTPVSSQSNPDGLAFEVKHTTWIVCVHGVVLIRCDYGQGNCDPSMQTICDGVHQL